MIINLKLTPNWECRCISGMKSLTQNVLPVLRSAPSECSFCLRPSKPWNSKMKLRFKGADRRYQYLISAKVGSIASAVETHHMRQQL